MNGSQSQQRKPSKMPRACSQCASSTFIRQQSYKNLPLLKLITCCVEAIHAANAVLWQPGEQAQKSQTDHMTTIPRGAAARLWQ